MAELFTTCNTIQKSIKTCRVLMHQAVTREDQLVLLPPTSTSTFVLASFRMLPSFYTMLETMTKEQMAELDLINEKMGRMLRHRDPCFQGIVVNGSVAVCVVADTAQLTPVFDEPFVQKLTDHLHEVVEQLEKDDEVLDQGCRWVELGVEHGRSPGTSDPSAHRCTYYKPPHPPEVIFGLGV